jgi:hypothetical protein
MPKIKIDTADKLFSQWVRLRDGKCLRCGSKVEFNGKGEPVSHQASHFQGRGKENTRFDPDNVCTLCMGCHMYFTAHPAEHYQWQVQRLGQDKVDQLVLKSNLHKKKDRQLEAFYWRQELKKLTNTVR